MLISDGVTDESAEMHRGRWRGHSVAACIVCAGAPSDRRVGVLMNLARDDREAKARISAIEKPLGEMGWINGKNLRIDYRWTAGDAKLVRSYAGELVRSGAEAFLANGTPAAVALQAETRSLPIVFVHVSNPIDYGFVQSLARPGGNMTGFTLLDWATDGKWLQILREIAPEFTHVAVMFNPDVGIYRGHLDTLTAAAPELRLQLVETRLRNQTEVEDGCRIIAAMRNASLLVLPDPFTGVHRELIVSAVAKHGIRAIYPFKYFAAIGGLASHGAESYRSVSTCSIVFGTHIEWRTSGGFACAATDQVRVGHQS